MKNVTTKTPDRLNKGETFVSPSGLTWKVEEVRNIGRGKVEVVSSRDKNKVAFSFRLDQEVEMA
jgi:hypothetical protein